jgi:hypothetical protein
MMSRTLSFASQLLMIVLAIGLSGCWLFSLDQNDTDLAQLIEQKRSAWQEQGLDNYAFTYNRTIGSTEIKGVQVFVRGGAIDSVTVGGESQELSNEFPTIDRLYDEVERNSNRQDRGGFQISFNNEFNYSERYRMEPRISTVGRSVVVSDFQTLAKSTDQG